MLFLEFLDAYFNLMEERIVHLFLLFNQDNAVSWLKVSIGDGGDLVAKSCPTPVTPWTVACRTPLSMEFSRQEYWSGLLFPSSGKGQY